MNFKIKIGLLALSGILVVSGCSQKSDVERGIMMPEGGPCAGTVEREILLRTVDLREGIGEVTQKITTRSKKAQRFYNQGLTYLYTYNWVEAARSFHEALRHDDKLAMAHLGLVRIYAGLKAVEDIRFHLNQATQLGTQKKISGKEKKWIELAVQQGKITKGTPEERQERLKAYQMGLEDLIRMDNDDPHPWVFLAHSKSPEVWAIGRTAGDESIRYYQAALNRDREHIGAHLFLSHTHENIKDYPAAAIHGDVVISLAPNLPQGYTRVATILPFLGKDEDALALYLKADEVHQEYFEEEQIEPWNDWHFAHNLQMMAGLLFKMGRSEDAEEAFQEVRKLVEQNTCGKIAV